MEDFSSTRQLVTLGLVDSSIGATAKGLALLDVEFVIAKDVSSLKYLIGHCFLKILLILNLFSYLFENAIPTT